MAPRARAARLGAAETYVAEDVPVWVGAHLEVDTTHMAIGGFSFGVQAASSSDLVEAIVLQRVEAEVDALQSRLRQRLGQRQALLRINGIGAAKLEKYADDVLEILA